MEHPARVAHITFHKCGSQWVRDVLTAPELVSYSGVPLFQSGQALSRTWPDQPEGTFMGPLYHKSREDWQRRQGPGQRAVVVLRDPRDRLVSWLFHRVYSQEVTSKKRALKEILLRLPLRQRLVLAIILNRDDHARMRTWAAQDTDAQTFMTSYEALTGDSFGEFGRVVRFLGWQVPEPVLAAVVKRLSFKTRSGREPGEMNIFSHYRKGVAGDWRNYFDTSLGALWEEHVPGLLVKLGYEMSDDWHRDLPARPELDEMDSGDIGSSVEIVALRTQLVKLQEMNAELLRGLVPSSMKEPRGTSR